MSTDERPSSNDRAEAYAAWRQRLTAQVEETKVIDLSDTPAEPEPSGFDWSTDALFAESRRVAEEETRG